MTTPRIKTAIDLDQALFQEVNRAARKLRVPPSRVISMALEEFFLRQREREINERFDRVYANGPTAEEQHLQDDMMEQIRQTVRIEKW